MSKYNGRVYFNRAEAKLTYTLHNCEKWLAINNNPVMIWIICVVRQGGFVAYHKIDSKKYFKSKKKA